MGLTEGVKAGDDDAKVKRLVEAIQALKAEINIPMSIKEANVEEKPFLACLDTLSEKAFDDQCTSCNARYPLISEIKDLYLDAYYGKKLY